MRRFMPLILAALFVAVTLSLAAAQSQRDVGDSSIAKQIVPLDNQQDSRMAATLDAPFVAYQPPDGPDGPPDGKKPGGKRGRGRNRDSGPASPGADDQGPPDGKGSGGPGDKGPGGPKGKMRPGLILPPFLQEMLKLSDSQKKQVEELQKEVDAKLNKILNDEQRKQLQDLRERGPGGFGPGGPGGPGGGGPGGPGGPGGKRQPPPPPGPGRDRDDA